MWAVGFDWMQSRSAVRRWPGWSSSYHKEISNGRRPSWEATQGLPSRQSAHRTWTRMTSCDAREPGAGKVRSRVVGPSAAEKT